MVKRIKDMSRRELLKLFGITAGATIAAADVWAKRPGTGIPARRLDEVIGRVARRAIASGRLVQWDDLDAGPAA